MRFTLPKEWILGWKKDGMGDGEKYRGQRIEKQIGML
jgi:hypothetical protein